MNVLDPPCPFGPAATVLRHDLGDFAATVIGLVRWAFEAGRGMVRREVLTAESPDNAHTYNAMTDGRSV
jgi:hypothetical protein